MKKDVPKPPPITWEMTFDEATVYLIRYADYFRAHGADSIPQAVSHALVARAGQGNYVYPNTVYAVRWRKKTWRVSASHRYHQTYGWGYYADVPDPLEFVDLPKVPKPPVIELTPYEARIVEAMRQGNLLYRNSDAAECGGGWYLTETDRVEAEGLPPNKLRRDTCENLVKKGVVYLISERGLHSRWSLNLERMGLL